MVGCSFSKLYWEMCGRPMGWEEKEEICTHATKMTAIVERSCRARARSIN